MFGFFPRNTSGRPFTPLSVSPYAWWDASRSDLITVGGGNAVSSWRDIVAGYDLVQGTGASQPVYSATGFNGSPVVTGDGLDDELTLAPVPPGIPTGAGACEWWLAVDQQTPTSNAATVIVSGIGGAGDTTMRTLRRVQGSGPVNRLRLRDSSGSDLAGVGIDFSNRCVIRSRATGAEISFELNGTSSAVTSRVSAIATDRLRMFAAPTAASATGHWAGGISALLITPLLTTEQANQMYVYFNARK